ncbi:HPr family phosphocarrier protein [Terribacillus saccharophilus]|uniref:HPr family phosphocarrier protein n=1 Tax=Terribacillus saccharophilus TaxID=361277 RepID=UPI0039824527
MLVERFIITDKMGIHARPATKLVQAANKFTSTIQLGFEDTQVNMKSITGIMTLGITEGMIIEVMTAGEDEREASQKLCELIEKECIGVSATAII